MFFLSFAVLSFYGELEWHFSKFGQIHIYQTSDRQLYHACVDTDDFWFATANHSDDGRCRRFLAPSPSSPHRGFTINSETEIVQFSGMDSLCLNFDKTLGYLFFDWESSDLFECKLYVLQNKSLTFDLKMLWPTVMAPSSSSAAAAVAVAGEICFSLSSIFYAIKQTIGPELQKPFVLLTGESSSKQRLALWMSYCNLSPVAVSVWHSELSRTQRSECAVHRVHGLTRSSALRKISKLDNQLHCVEDVINIIANITDGTVTYLSSLNMPTFPLATARNQSWANIEEINDDISDIHRVLTAFQGADGVQGIFITGLNYPSEGSSTASVEKYLKLKRLNYQASLVMLLNSCLNAHSDEDFADAVENLHSVATAFLQDYSASLLQFRLVDTPYGDPSRLSKTSIRSKYILRILYLNALHDTGFISGDGGIDQLRCPSVLSICSGMHRSRRELLVRFMLSALLPSSQYLDSSGDVIIQRHWSMHIAASVTLSLPAAMWNPPAEALHNFRLCRSSCKAGTNFEISAADNRMSRELTTACPDLLRVLSLAAKIILYKAADASTDFTVSILDFNALEWSQHVHSVMNTKLSLPLYDKYGSGELL